MLCLGEALVDLIGQRPGDRLPELGAAVELAGGAGDDVWGRWLRDRLAAERVGLSLFTLAAGVETALAFVAVDARGEPSYSLHGESTGAIMDTLDDRVEAAVAGASALLITTNTLIGTAERAITMRARDAALAAGRPVIFDANLRLGRWPSAREAVACARAVLPAAFVVRANVEEAELITGERDPERAAAALHDAGAELVVLTRGGEGAMLRGAVSAAVSRVRPARVVNTAGAGDALTGTLLARLAVAGFAPEAVAGALPEAVAAGTAACERWGAV